MKRIYINDSPFTITINKNCPGRIGRWFGLEIVEHYMNRVNSKYLISKALFILFGKTSSLYNSMDKDDIKKLLKKRNFEIFNFIKDFLCL